MEELNYSRIFIVVIDSLGIGATADADKFNSWGANTLGHVGEHFRARLQLPTLQRLGIGNLCQLYGIPAVASPRAYYGKLKPLSVVSSDYASQWEMMGVPILQEPTIFLTGFPNELVQKISQHLQRNLIANRFMSMKTALREYGTEQLITGDLILYTDSSSTMWLAANQATVQRAELAKICKIAQTIIEKSQCSIGQINGILFAGKNARTFYPVNLLQYVRPPRLTVLDLLCQSGVPVRLVGKVKEAFAGKVTSQPNVEENHQNLQRLRAIVNDDHFTGLAITNLGDFSRKYGRMRNPEGFGNELMAVDEQLGEIIKELHPRDLLLVTANHGNDPTYPGEDHTREMLPLFAYSPSLSKPRLLTGDLLLSDIGITLLDNFAIRNHHFPGNSLLNQLQ